MRQSLGTNGVNEYNILKFSAYYETAKFTGIQSDLLGSIGNFETGKLTSHVVANETQVFRLS